MMSWLVAIDSLLTNLLGIGWLLVGIVLLIFGAVTSLLFGVHLLNKVVEAQRAHVPPATHVCRG